MGGWGQTVRSGSEVAIASPARKRKDDGIVFYRESNGAILTEGINGIAGPQYSRYVLRVRRNLILTRGILRGAGSQLGEKADIPPRRLGGVSR